MTTRSTVHFCIDGLVKAIVLRHYDGYPEVAGSDLVRFLSELPEEHWALHPSYLAAEFVRWLYSQGELHLAITTSADEWDVKYRYEVDSSELGCRPALRCWSMEASRFISILADID